MDRGDISAIGSTIRTDTDRKEKLMNYYDSLRSYLDQRARYNRTVREIRSMPNDIALDLDIDRSKARTIARNAVYGA